MKRSVVRRIAGARSGSTTPSPRRTAAFMMLNAEVAMPRPIESPDIVSSRIAGWRANRRTAYRRSAARRAAGANDARGAAARATGHRRSQRLATSWYSRQCAWGAPRSRRRATNSSSRSACTSARVSRPARATVAAALARAPAVEAASVTSVLLPQSHSRFARGHGGDLARSAVHSASPCRPVSPCRPGAPPLRSWSIGRSPSLRAVQAPRKWRRWRSAVAVTFSTYCLDRDGVGGIAERAYRKEREFFELAEPVTLHGTKGYHN